MGRKRKHKGSLRIWLLRLFCQPPKDFYGRTSVYLSGGRMEIEQFRRIRSYDEDKLCLELGRGILTIYGDKIKIETLSARRLVLQGQILRTDFSKE